MGNRLLGTPRPMTTAGDVTTMASSGIPFLGSPQRRGASPTAQEGARILARARPATGWEAGRPGSERNVGEDGWQPLCVSGCRTPAEAQSAGSGKTKSCLRLGTYVRKSGR